ncbi:MAG: hypothetical protein RJA07_1544 [Bacteroidota bacterium]|jgi:hypothetical protein
MLKRSGLFFVFSVIVINVIAQVALPKKSDKVVVKTEAIKIVKAENSSLPEFKFEVEEHDFGNVKEGPEVKYDFVFTNIGKEPIVIQDVHASCGCTTPVWSREPILPGAKSKITAVYNTKGRPGMFNKSITIKSNAAIPEKMLIIKGVVESETTTKTIEKAPNIINEFPK